MACLSWKQRKLTNSFTDQWPPTNTDQLLHKNTKIDSILPIAVIHSEFHYEPLKRLQHCLTTSTMPTCSLQLPCTPTVLSTCTPTIHASDDKARQRNFVYPLPLYMVLAELLWRVRNGQPEKTAPPLVEHNLIKNSFADVKAKMLYSRNCVRRLHITAADNHLFSRISKLFRNLLHFLHDVISKQKTKNTFQSTPQWIIRKSFVGLSILPLPM